MKAAIVISALIACVSSCAPQPEAVPRATAYPRPALPDTASTTTQIGSITTRICAQAIVAQPRSDWLSVSFPTLNASIHITATDTTAQALQQVKANRMQRLMLNIGSATSSNREFTTANGFDAIITTAPHSPTPVQFLATDQSTIVVSGAVYIPEANIAAPDSIAPVIQFFEHEALRIITSIRHD